MRNRSRENLGLEVSPEMRLPSLFRAWRPAEGWQRFPAGVSLHSHTSCSSERLLGTRLTWRPPLSPVRAYEVERRQIENSLGMQAIVSLTDHDTIEAPLQLRRRQCTRDLPISVEWSVPFAGTEFHLGVHGLAARGAQLHMQALAAFTADPRESELPALLEWLAEDPETLIVFNHPLWDEWAIGHHAHIAAVRQFLALCRRWLHALEFNGLRSWSENHEVSLLARERGLPVVAGGDRHGSEPNALLNLTRARSFAEFVDEVRTDLRSHVLILPQYRNPLALRVACCVAEVLWASLPRPVLPGVRVPDSI